MTNHNRSSQTEVPNTSMNNQREQQRVIPKKFHIVKKTCLNLSRDQGKGETKLKTNKEINMELQQVSRTIKHTMTQGTHCQQKREKETQSTVKNNTTSDAFEVSTGFEEEEARLRMRKQIENKIFKQQRMF